MAAFFSFLFVFLASASFALGQEIQGILLLDRRESLLSEGDLDAVIGLDASRIDLPGPAFELNKMLFLVYDEKPWDEETLREIKRTIYLFYQKYFRPFIRVFIPEQDKSLGKLQIVVEESKVGEIEIVGNKWVPTSMLQRYLSVQSGDVIAQEKLAKDLDFINRNPFRQVNLVYSPGKKKDVTDLKFEVEDRRRFRFYAGADNTGVLSTGRQRAFVGFSLSPIFNLDHILFYQYTTNYDIKRFHSNTLQYLAFLPSKTVLNFFGGLSILHSEIPSPNRRNKGTNAQGSIRYQIPFLITHTLSQDITLGFDLKNTNNTMEFVDYDPVFGQTVNMTQLILGYNMKWQKKGTIIESGLELFCSPGRWLPNQTNEDFGSLRPDAKNHWIYANGFFNWSQPLGFSFSSYTCLRGQWSSQTLLPSEQLGIGGYDTVRGYDQRQLNVDSGLFGSYEVHFPSHPFLRRKGSHRDRMYFLLFIDGGYGIEKTSAPGEKTFNFLLGTGPGVRYELGSHLTARVDWGIKLHEQQDFTGGRSMVHFRVVGSF